MNRFKILQRSALFALICALFFLPLLAVRGQDSQVITAEGTFTGNGLTVPFTLEFPPNGGPVTGTIDYSGEENIFWVGAPDGEICPIKMKLSINGTFSGGDGGAANGDFVGREEIWCPSSLFPDEPTESTTYGPDFPFYGWSGNFFANGTGNGVMHLGTTCLEPDCKFAGGYDAPWQVTFSAAEFQAALPNQVTSEYIYTTYGIRMEDSFGGDGYDQAAWSDHEISLLNDVLKQIPPDLLKNMSLTSIIRSKASLDKDGNKDPGVFGEYFSCNRKVDPDCTGSSAAIRIYDHASSSYDFANDPNGDTEFKATILHEMIHAMQYHKDSSSVYANPVASPLVQNYMDATRPNTAIENGIETGINANGWGWYGTGPGWRLIGVPDNQPPTNYGKTDPLEDMSESTMIYVYDPQRLKASSPQRYNFIRDQIFGGIEYENGVQKKP